MNTKIISAFALLSLLACSAYKLAEPTESDVGKIKPEFANVTLQQLQEGKKLYESNCNLCHKLFNPSKISENEWRKVIPPMVKKVNKKTGQTTLTPEDEQKILQYILAIRERK